MPTGYIFQILQMKRVEMHAVHATKTGYIGYVFIQLTKSLNLNFCVKIHRVQIYAHQCESSVKKKFDFLL